MFLVLLTYIRPLDEVDAFVAAHRDYLARHYANGTFLLSGRKEPRTGGVIMARCASVSELHSVLAEDPFQQNGVASYQVIEFIPTMAAPLLGALMAT